MTRGLLKHHLFWGIGLGAAVVACIQVLTWLGLGMSHLTWFLTYVLVVVFAVLGARSLRQRLGSRPRFLQAVLLIAVMILVSRFIYQTYMFFYINYVDPTWVDTVAAVWAAQLEKAGTSPERIASQIDGFRRQWQTSNIFTLGIVSYGVAQFILALLAVVVAVVQPWKKRPAAEEMTGSA